MGERSGMRAWQNEDDEHRDQSNGRIKEEGGGNRPYRGYLKKKKRKGNKDEENGTDDKSELVEGSDHIGPRNHKTEETGNEEKADGRSEGRVDEVWDAVGRGKATDSVQRSERGTGQGDGSRTNQSSKPNSQKYHLDPEELAKQLVGYKELFEQTLLENNTLLEEKRQLELRLGETEELLQQRTADLTTAQAFLNKADAVSGADVKRMLEALNAEIFQFAALLTDRFKFDPTPNPDQPAFDLAWNRVLTLLGERFALVLIPRRADIDLAQIALQSHIAAYAFWVIQLWTVAPFSQNTLTIHSYLNDIYNLIRTSEKQSVASKWRSLVRSKDREFYTKLGKLENRSSLMGHLRQDLAYLLIVLGINLPHDEICNVLSGRYSLGLSIMVDKMLALNKTLGEDIISEEFSIGYFPAGEVYDSEQMQDSAQASSAGRKTSKSKTALSDWTQLRVDKILSTCELGLVWHLQEKELPPKYLLKPKVILESILAEGSRI